MLSRLRSSRRPNCSRLASSNPHIRGLLRSSGGECATWAALGFATDQMLAPLRMSPGAAEVLGAVADRDPSGGLTALADALHRTRSRLRRVCS